MIIQRWKHLAESKNIKTQMLTRGVGATLIPLLVLMAIVGGASATGCARLADQDLNRSLVALLTSCKQSDVHIVTALHGAGVVLNRTGKVHFSPAETYTWTAKNQLTQETTQARLPLMQIGALSIRQVSDFSHEAALVDEINALYQTSATIFQRMNERGDMLRIATTIKNADGMRAIGTYIPAADPDGAPNKVIDQVLRGHDYSGRAFVVNSWNMAAYEPIQDERGRVVGMVYTGLPETQLRDELSAFRQDLASVGPTDLFVLHAAEKARGLFVISSNPELDGKNGWDVRDQKGNLYVQDIRKQALTAKPGEISQGSYWTQAGRKMLVRFAYFPAWDWIVGIQQPEDDYQALPNLIRRLFLISNIAPLGVSLAAGIIAIMIWRRFANRLKDQVVHVINQLNQGSRQFSLALQTICRHSESVGVATRELLRATEAQSSSATRTTESTSAVTETAHENSGTAERMKVLSVEAEQVVTEAKQTLADVNQAIVSIHRSSDEALTIIDTINEISFATKIVALNAAVEAARAGTAGRTFSMIAGEVKDLAAKAAAAARETQDVINNTRDEVSRGENYVRKLVAALEPMSEKSDQVGKLAVQVSKASGGQAESMRQLLTALEDNRKTSVHSVQIAQQTSGQTQERNREVAALSLSVKAVDEAVSRLSEQFLSN